MPRAISKTMSKETAEEKISNAQNKAKIVTAIISSGTTLIVGLVVAFLGFPPFQDWVKSWGKPAEGQELLAVEQIPQRIFAYYGEAENLGGFARLELIYDEPETRPSYELDYNIPGDQAGYAGMAFQFDAGFNLSGYKAVECTVIFNQLSDVVDVYFKDIGSNFNTIRVSNNGANEMILRYEFTNFPIINFNAIKEFGIVVSSEFSTGSHKVRIKDVHFIK